MSELPPGTAAADDFEAIARHLKEIEAEKAAALQRPFTLSEDTTT